MGICRGGFRGSSLGLLEPPFLKLATYLETVTELAGTCFSSHCSDQLQNLGVVLGKWVW